MRTVDSIENECWIRVWGKEIRVPCGQETGFQPVKAILKKVVMVAEYWKKQEKKNQSLVTGHEVLSLGV